MKVIIDKADNGYIVSIHSPGSQMRPPETSVFVFEEFADVLTHLKESLAR
jgi:hypothetical protein